MKSRVNVITSLLILAAFLTLADTNIVTANTSIDKVDIKEISPDKISHQKDLPDIAITLEFEFTDGNDLTKEDIVDANLIIIPEIPDANQIEAIFDEKDVTFDVNAIEIKDVNDSNATTITITTVTIIATFDINELMNNLPEDDDDKIEFEIECWVNSNDIFDGLDTKGIIIIVEASDYISEISFDQIWDYGDPTDSTDLMYEFNLAIYRGGSQAADMDDDILRIEFQTPAKKTFDIIKKDNKWPDPLEYKVRSADPADLQNYGDEEYTITLHLSDDMQVQTTAWFGNPYTKQPIPQPTHEPVLSSELQQQSEESLVTFSWERCEDPNVDEIYTNMLGTFNNGLGDKFSDFDIDQTSWGPLLLLEGSWQTELIFSTMTQDRRHWWNRNDDKIWIGVAKSSRCRYRITIEDYPWNIYEVWGGNKWIEYWEGSFEYIDDLEAYGYESLGQSDGSKTFLDKDNEFDYYLIATNGQCFIDSIQGSDEYYYDSFGQYDTSNILNKDNLLGEHDGQYAILGSDEAGNDYGYNGYFAFTDPNDWKNLTVFTSDRNLNLDKNLLSVTDEKGNIKDPNDIDPNDIISYGIDFNTNDFPLAVKDGNDVKNEKDGNNVTPNTVYNIKVVDILSDHVSFLSAFPTDSNEVTGSYDPIAHTYTWQYPTVDSETPKGHRLTVRVEPDTLPGTTITNFVTIDSDETPPSMARSIDATIPYEPLNITKRTINSDGNDINWIESGKRFIYQICFDNNNNGPQIGGVNLVDILPNEVSYVAYKSDNPNFSGSYDADDHSFKGKLDALEPGLITCMEITVEVYEDIPSTIINNVVTINSNETPQAMAEVGIEVIPPLEVADLIITPNILRRNGTSQYITAVVKFPSGIQQSEIDLENIPELYYQDRNTGDFILIGYGSRPVLSGTEICTLFNRAELMDAIYGYGEFTLKVVGQLKSSLTFYGYENIHISKFTGD